MASKVTVIGISKEFDSKDNYNSIVESAKIMSGRAAGICYMKDDYLSKGIQDNEKAIKRAVKTAKGGHYSVFDHYHVNLLIETPKMMAMILNSTRLYSTSEKSGRYTIMHADTEAERDMYGKWRGVFTKLIEEGYGKVLKKTEIEKLALENARYLVSVWVPTVLEFTVPFSRLVLLTQWLDDMANSIMVGLHEKHIGAFVNNQIYYERLFKECALLSAAIKSAVDFEDIPIFSDNKNLGIEFVAPVNFVTKYTKYGMLDELPQTDTMDKKESYADSYVSKYCCSFTALADLERHRTLHYTFNFADRGCFVPELLENHPELQAEWIADYLMLVNKFGCIPQATLIEVTESGRYEDFVLKTKERLCARAQLEVSKIVAYQAHKFAESENLSEFNTMVAKGMIKDKDKCCYRCEFKDFKCTEGCKIKTDCVETRGV